MRPESSRVREEYLGTSLDFVGLEVDVILGSASGQEAAGTRVPGHRVRAVVGSDLVAQLIRSFGTYGRVAVPALGHPAAQPEALDQVGAVPVPAQVVKRSFPVTHGSKLYQVWQPC